MDEHYESPPNKRSRKERMRLLREGVAIPNSYENMEPVIWKELPEDLVEAVLARLPVSKILEFRSVCQKWNSLLTSHNFSEHCAQVPQSQPWIYTIAVDHIITRLMYDPSMKKWRRPTISEISPKLFCSPAASAGGLVCFFDIERLHFYICNPLTQALKQLPASSAKFQYYAAMGMIKNGNSPNGGYKVLCFVDNGEYDIYDSLQDSWTCHGNIPSSIKLPLSMNVWSHTVSVGSTLYFMRSKPKGIVSYNMVSGVWEQYLIPTPPNSIDHDLAECGGRIFLVGALTKNSPFCVCIWELQKSTLLWKEVDRMPSEWCLEYYGEFMRMVCLGNKDLFMLSVQSRRMNHIVTYDVMKREWLKVPELPLGRRNPWIPSGIAFYPCLTAVP